VPERGAEQHQHDDAEVVTVQVNAVVAPVPVENAENCGKYALSVSWRKRTARRGRERPPERGDQGLYEDAGPY
jgi:hypothetical protein